MEYIPDPLSGHENGIEVPYLQSPSVPYYTHDFGRWQAFPERCKWEYSSLLRDFSHNGIPNDEGAAALLQSWLYFGLLVEFFGKLSASRFRVPIFFDVPAIGGLL